MWNLGECSERDGGTLSLRLAVRNLVRHRTKSILSGIIGILTVLLLVIYAGNIGSVTAQLASLPEVMPIRAVVSSLDGSMNAGLAIKEQNLERVLASEEVKDPVVTVQLKIGFGDFTPQEWEGNLNYYAAGVNDLAGVPGLQSEEIRFIDQAGVDLLKTEEAVCVMDARTMEQNGYQPGDMVTLNLYYYRYGNSSEGYTIYIEPLAIAEYRIVGSMDIKEYTGNVIRPEIILPFENVRQIFHRNNMTFTADSLSFTVRDPFRLNECKEDMHEIGFLEVAKNALPRYDGNALMMKDDMFINAAENLRESLAIMTGMLPFVIILLVFIGYLCSYLLIQNRKAEYATMRSVGMGWGQCFGVLFLENLMIEAAACAVASLFALLCGGVGVGVVLLADAAFLLSFLTGSSAALWSFRSLSVMEVLSAGD